MVRVNHKGTRASRHRESKEKNGKLLKKDFDEEGHRVEMKFESVKRVKLGEEHC